MAVVVCALHTPAAAGEPMSDSLNGLPCLLDKEVLDQVLVRLSAEDVARVGSTCRHLWSQISTGQHALQLWRGHCQEILGELPVTFIAAACKADEASTWLRLYASACMADTLHWSPATPSVEDLSLRAGSTATPCTQQQQQQTVSGPDALLARTGHTATAAGSLLVLIGGDLRDGPVPATADVAVLDLAGRRLIQPRLHGQQQPSLRHHCTARLQLQQGSALHDQVSAAVHEALQSQQGSTSDTATAPEQLQQCISTGHTLLVFGGLQPHGCEQPTEQDQLHVLWLHPDASWGVWLHPATSGATPAPRAYACCAAIYNSTQLLVYGGWVNGSLSGTVQSDVGEFDGYLLLCVYILDPASLSWSRVPTRPLNEPPRPGHAMLGPTTCPGPRRQALSCLRTNPVTGKQEFMLLGGCGADGLADFVPYSLNLDTFCWNKGPATGYLPPARATCSAMLLTPTWLLLQGGQGPCRQPLHDIQRLHLPTLSWRPPVPVNIEVISAGTTGGGSPTSSTSSSDGVAAVQLCAQQQQQQCVPTEAGGGAANHCHTTGCSTEACVVLGGMYDGPYGRSIVPRLQVLLPGPLIPPAVGIQRSRSTAAAGLMAAAAATGVGKAQMAAFAQSFLPQPVGAQMQQQAAWEWTTTSSCCCGSCCGCLAAKTTASGAHPGGPLACGAGLSGVEQATQGKHQQGVLQQQLAAPGASSTACCPAADVDSQQPPCGSHARTCHPGPSGIGLGSGCGKQVSRGKLTQRQAHADWQGALEIEPVPTVQGYVTPAACFDPALHSGPGLRPPQQGLYGGDAWQAGVCGISSAAAPVDERLWQTGSSTGEGKVLQVLLAVVVVALGLVLMAPSLMLHQDS